MRKIIVLSSAFILATNTAIAQNAPIPKCSCDDISSQINLEKKAELEMQDKAKLEKQETQTTSPINQKELDEKTEKIIQKTAPKKHWWQFKK